MAKRDWVSASEIGSYVFCPRRYWLQRVKRVLPGAVEEVLLAGVRNHHRHGVRYDWQRRLYRAGRWAIVVAVLILVMAVSFALRGTWMP